MDPISRRAVLLSPATLAAAPQPQILRVKLPEEPLTFPPSGKAYRENGEAHRIWRRILIEAPDAVVVSGPSNASLAEALKPRGILVRPEKDSVPKRLGESEAHREMARRLAMRPAAFAEGVAKHYGQRVNQPVYVETVALLARLRLGSVKEVEELLRPWLRNERDSLEKATASHYAGHLVFGKLARQGASAMDARARVRAAADAAMVKPLDNEMSDSVFMVCPILAEAGEAKYYDRAVTHFEYMQKLCERPDGLWRHSPLCEAAWGRGNAFPLLGLALTLSRMPASHAGFGMLKDAYVKLARRLCEVQDENGCWHQVIDEPSSFSEFSATAMIGTALERGRRQGWISESTVAPHIAKAWTAVKRRVTPDGEIIDVCESTGKQKTAKDYFDREAIFGHDNRGGSMALLFSTELAGLPG